MGPRGPQPVTYIPNPFSFPQPSAAHGNLLVEIPRLFLKSSHCIFLNRDREGPGCPGGYDAGLTNQTIVGSIPVTTEFYLIPCDSYQVPKWFGTQYSTGKSVFGVAPAIVQWAHYVAYV